MINVSQTKVNQKLMSSISLLFGFTRMSLIICFGTGEMYELLSY